jgi:hypothetical protein
MGEGKQVGQDDCCSKYQEPSAPGFLAGDDEQLYMTRIERKGINFKQISSK